MGADVLVAWADARGARQLRLDSTSALRSSRKVRHYFLKNLVRRHVHEPAVLGSAIVADPADNARLVDERA